MSKSHRGLRLNSCVLLNKHSHGLRRPLALIFPLSASLFLSACAGSGLELAALSQADPASGSAASSITTSSIETSALAPAGKSGGETKSGAGETPLSPEIVKARGLRSNGDLAGAMGVLAQAAQKAPKDKALMRERGLLALEMGQIGDAKALLTKADDADAPDWRIKSALGSALAASGDQTGAQREFAAALKLSPDHPSILNNLALSYALDGRHEQAEKLLRRAALAKQSTGKSKQNLALLLGLRGELDEARKFSEATLPRDEARANISYLERLKTSGSRVSRVDRGEAAASKSAAATTLGALMPPN
ncbi:MAG: tetratricopeptide repeat protein [Hyphomicrobiaceae bacterium]|nr:tetratricopeptide repeat protein [Hyphomicrobiaceae bacterium]